MHLLPERSRWNHAYSNTSYHFHSWYQYNARVHSSAFSPKRAPRTACDTWSMTCDKTFQRRLIVCLLRLFDENTPPTLDCLRSTWYSTKRAYNNTPPTNKVSSRQREAARFRSVCSAVKFILLRVLELNTSRSDTSMTFFAHHVRTWYVVMGRMYAIE